MQRNTHTAGHDWKGSNFTGVMDFGPIHPSGLQFSTISGRGFQPLEIIRLLPSLGAEWHSNWLGSPWTLQRDVQIKPQWPLRDMKYQGSHYQPARGDGTRELSNDAPNGLTSYVYVSVWLIKYRHFIPALEDFALYIFKQAESASDQPEVLKWMRNGPV